MKRVTWQQWVALTVYMLIMISCLCLAMQADAPTDTVPQLKLCLISLFQSGSAVIIASFVTFVYVRLGIFRAVWENIDDE